MVSQVQLLVGTRKGAFIYTSDESRREWELSEPLITGWPIYHMVLDARADPPRIYAAANNSWWGATVAKSDDGGQTWDFNCEGLGFPEDLGITIGNFWYVQPGPASEPGVVYAGVDPAGLFRSEDWGQSWASVEGMNRHELRPFWSVVRGQQYSGMSLWEGTGPEAISQLDPDVELTEEQARRHALMTSTGKGGILHSIEIDPRDSKHLLVAISGGGSYATTDGGETWQLFGQRPVPAAGSAREMIEQAAANAPPGIDPWAEFDMHTMRMDPKNPDRLWTQAHTGVYRSDDRGVSWSDVTKGLPSFHGFPIAVTRREPDAAYVVPLQADEFRVSPGQFTVYRTRDSGDSWEALTDGLPGPQDYQSVYREGLDTDGLDPEGVYVGTSNGQVYASADGGDHWQRLPGTLPPVLSVTCAVSDD